MKSDLNMFELATPPEAPLDMPTQPINAARIQAPRESDGRWRLGVLLAVSAAVTFIAGYEMHGLLAEAGMSPIEWVALALFVVNFFWISSASGTAFIGALRLGFGRKQLGPANTPLETNSRTAVIFPVYNEDMTEVLANADEMYQSLVDAKSEKPFEFFFLSDTQDVGRAEIERTMIAEWMARRPEAPIFYRRRTLNIGKKAGNVADFVQRWGGRYDYMICLDADSLMSAQAMTELVRRIDQRPRTALIQTLPVIIRAQTVFARTQQFALRAYGAMFGAGLAWWAGGASNYWGHNAIIRVRAFADHAGLPVLPGKAPFGGHILSHDFAEAALLRRAGWRIELHPDIAGSYEQSPPTLQDFATRDRRWCQGNLQHIGLIGAKGLDWVSRAHIGSGVMAYCSSLFWLSLILVGIALGYQAQAEIPDYFPTRSLMPAWPVEDLERAVRLIGLTAAIVFSPKWLSLLLWLGGRLPGWDRNPRFLGGLIAETILSALVAPILMIGQASAVVQTLFGGDSGWKPQSRSVTSQNDGLLRSGAYHLILALVLIGAYLMLSPNAAIWAAPVALSLALAAPLAIGLAQMTNPGGWIWSMTAIPEERIKAIVRS